MQQFSAVRGLAAVAAILFLVFLPGCGGGGGSSNTKVTSVILSPTTVSLNEGAVAQLSATAYNSAGVAVAADISFSSSNTAIATISSGGLICGGVWDANIINCNATQGTAGVGQVTITATATAFNVTATTKVYVHERVDSVQAVVGGSCTSSGQPISISGKAFSTSAPGCSPASPCDITSTVGPFSFGSNDTIVAASSAGIQSTFSSTTNSPTYTSGGTITGSKGQTCDLSNFNGVVGATATVALTGQNTIASGTHLTITSPGFGGTVAPTTATLSDGTATCSGTATVVTVLTSGVLTAEAPGATTVFASVSGVNSVGTPFLTCPVNSIVVHGANTSDTSFTVSAPNTQALNADVIDTSGKAITPTLTWGSSSNATGTVAVASGSNAATVTAVTGGTTYITASCTSPTCNKGVPTQYSQNVVTISVPSGTSTTVYAASSNSKSLVPIDTSNNSVGTAITLPNYPNSIIADPAGKAVYLGSSSGLMAIAKGSTTVTTFNVNGTILAISPDGNFMLISDDTNNRVQYFSVASGRVVNSQSSLTANSSAYTPDSAVNLWVNATELGVGYSTGFINGIPTPYTPSFIDLMAQGGLFYISSATGHQVYVYSTCDQTQNQILTATSPTLIKAIPNGTGAVAVDPPSIDVISTPSTLSAGCPVTTQSTINSYDLGVGTFTPQQLLMSLDGTTAWVISSDIPEVVGFNLPGLVPTTIPLAGGATPINGGLILNGTQLWVGASDNTVHEIFPQSHNDAAQIAVNLKDGNGNVTPPNLVCVLP